jgi:hypothetical protein
MGSVDEVGDAVRHRCHRLRAKFHVAAMCGYVVVVAGAATKTACSSHMR